MTDAFDEDSITASMFPIALPPLLERPIDLGDVRRVLRDPATKRLGLSAVPVNGDDVRQLSEYRWPGNLCEMAALIDWRC